MQIFLGELARSLKMEAIFSGAYYQVNVEQIIANVINYNRYNHVLTRVLSIGKGGASFLLF